ncbi:peptide deformylase [Microbispora sp. RL4-1S]|uniref:Peptide deformylase-like n=1 Tax=Microbispora oryzae TaxID=2806554 RepID=A0A941AS27_9ACTN|nr:peptide deformylase [Microbispora oryzae]MBP2707189.1 peptide deformylase [Microbispora oryzae]
MERTGVARLVEGVITAPHPVLTRPAVRVDPEDTEVAAAASRLLAAMRGLPGCRGLAAPQLGIGWRLMCVDVSGHPLTRSCAGELVLVNPEIVEAARWEVAREGCPSVPGLTADVRRAGRVTVRGVRPYTGEPLTIRSDAFEARCIQHQIDHLNGLLFLDRAIGARAVHGQGGGRSRLNGNLLTHE